MLREELQHLQEQCSYVGEVNKIPCHFARGCTYFEDLVPSRDSLRGLFEPLFFLRLQVSDTLQVVLLPSFVQVVKPMDKKKVLVKVHPEGKFVVDVDKNIDINDVTPNCRYCCPMEKFLFGQVWKQILLTGWR